MPTEDYSNSSRTAKLRQKASLKGLNKVARALDYDTQLSMKLGGVVHKTKNSSGISYDCACPPNGTCVGTFQEDGKALGNSYECDGNQCVGPVDTGFQESYPQINAIPGTSTTTAQPVAIVNCGSSPVNVTYFVYKMPDGPTGPCQKSGSLGLLQPGNVIISDISIECRVDPDDYFVYIYTFSQESVAPA